MNILFYHRRGIVAHLGGIPRITSTLIDTFRSHGHQVYLLASHYKEGFEYDSLQFFIPSSDLDESNNVDFVADFCRTHSIDVIINQAALSIPQCVFLHKVRMLSGVKVLNVLHNSILVPSWNFAYVNEWKLRSHHLAFIFHVLKCKLFAKLKTKLFILRNRKCYQQIIDTCDKVVVLHNGLLDELEKTVGHKVDSAVVIPNCLPYEIHCNQDVKEKLVVWVGRIDFDVKRIDLMLRIWKKVHASNPDWKLQILGSGAQLNLAVQYAKKLNLSNVEFVGQVNAEEYYKRASIVCVTSTHESFSLVTVEGMMNGCVPVLFNSFPAASMIVTNHKDGVLVDNFCVDSFASELTAILQDDEMRRTYSVNAIKRSGFFTTDNIYPMWEVLIESLIK